MNNQKRLAALREASIWDFDLWAYDEWQRLNSAYFADTLEIGQIFWGITPYGACIGQYQPWRNCIVLHSSLIEPSNTWSGGLSGRERFASDVLLHEMIHQAIHQGFGHLGCGHEPKKGACSSHNNMHWVSEINRIAPLISLPANAGIASQRRIKSEGASGKGVPTWVTPEGCISRIDLACWPHQTRPAGYYENIPTEIVNRLG